MALPGFIFGGDTGIKTPEDLARARAIAEALLMPQRPAQNVGEGLAVLGQAIRGRREMNAANRAQATGDASASSAIMSALGGGQFPAAPTGGGGAVSSALSGPKPDATQAQAASAPPMVSSGDTSALTAAFNDPTQRAKLPAGMRNNNPGNIKFVGQKVPGIVGPSQNTDQGDPQAVFDSPESGMRAMYGLLGRKYAGGKRTANDIIAGQGGWTPGNFQAAANVARNAGLKPDQDINFNDPQQAARFMRGLMLQEHGNASKLYPDSLILSAITGQPQQAPAVAAVNAEATGQPQQVASLDPSAGMPAAPSPVAAALQLPQQGPIPQGRPDVAAALNGAPAGAPAPLPDAQFNNRFAGMPTMMGNGAGPVAPVGLPVSPMPQPGVDPTATAATALAPGAAPPLSTRQIGPDPMGAQDQSGKPQGPGTPGEIRKGADGKAYQYAQTTGMAGATGDSGWIETSMPAQQQGGGPDMSQYPVIAGGTSDAVQPGNGTPSMQDLLKLASNPWAMQKYGPIIQTLLAQHMKQTDPAYALDIATKQAGLALDQKKLGGSFTGDSMDAQAWNILQTRDPSSKEYQTAYSIVSQPKTQLVQTANGMVPVQVPPQLPGWLKAPGGADGLAVGPTGATPAAGASAAAAPAGPGGTAVPGAPIPGTQQKHTETEGRNGAISKILLNEVPTLGANFNALADTKGQLLSATLGKYGNPWQSEEYQRAATAVKTSVANVLYSLSGASSNPDEVVKQIEVLTPQIGDKPGTIADKLQRFKTYVRAVSSEANDPELTKTVEDALSQMDAGAAPAGAGGTKNKTSTGVEWSIGQ